MARKNITTVYFRRKREQKTNYKKRIKLLHSEKPRLVVRISLKNVRAQIIEFKPTGDNVLVSAESRELPKLGWKYNKANLPAAYLVGLLVGKKALANKVKGAILDKGFRSVTEGSKVFAVLKGAADSGLDIPHSEAHLPGEDRISGKHIADYAKSLKGDKQAYQKEFGAYLKANVNPEDIEDNFKKTKSAIQK